MRIVKGLRETTSHVQHARNAAIRAAAEDDAAGPVVERLDALLDRLVEIRQSFGDSV